MAANGDWVIATFFRITRHDIEMRVIGGFGLDKQKATEQASRLRTMYVNAGGPPPVIKVVRIE